MALSSRRIWDLIHVVRWDASDAHRRRTYAKPLSLHPQPKIGMTRISDLATALNTPTWNRLPVRIAADHRNIQSRLHLWLDMISKGTCRGSGSPVTRTPTLLSRSVMKRHEVHQHAKMLEVTRAYRLGDSGRRRMMVGTSMVTVLVAAVNSTYPRLLTTLNHW